MVPVPGFKRGPTITGPALYGLSLHLRAAPRRLARQAAGRTRRRSRGRTLAPPQDHREARPPSADAFRVLRFVYNRGVREHPDLPLNPTTTVDYHELRRRKVDVDAESLWGKVVLGLPRCGAACTRSGS